MKTDWISILLIVVTLLTGCGREPAPTATPVATAPSVLQPVLTTWQQGDKPAAVRAFLETDWSARPLFSAGSPLSLSEAAFSRLSEREARTKSEVVLRELDLVKQLAAAVTQAGRDAAAGGNAATARKHFEAVALFGTALDNPDGLRIAQLVGQALRRQSDTELSKLPR